MGLGWPGSTGGLILLDLHLPDLPGGEEVLRLRADPLHGGHRGGHDERGREPGQVRRLLAAGARDYLTKPVGASTGSCGHRRGFGRGLSACGTTC